MAGEDDKRWIDLTKVSVLALEQSAFSQKLLDEMLRGFGIRAIKGARDFQSAQTAAEQQTFDLLIADPGFADGRGLDFVKWLRHAKDNHNRFLPIILMIGHSTIGAVNLSRNSGANFVIAKPCTPKALLDRILWVARDKRPYVEVGAYAGPDRRIRVEDMAEGHGRRLGDAEAPAGAQPQEKVA